MDFLFWIGSGKFGKFFASQKSGYGQKLVKCQTEGAYLYLDNKRQKLNHRIINDQWFVYQVIFPRTSRQSSTGIISPFVRTITSAANKRPASLTDRDMPAIMYHWSSLLVILHITLKLAYMCIWMRRVTHMTLIIRVYNMIVYTSRIPTIFHRMRKLKIPGSRLRNRVLNIDIRQFSHEFALSNINRTAKININIDIHINSTHVIISRFMVLYGIYVIYVARSIDGLLF